MAPKPRRRKPTPAEIAAIRRMIEQGQQSEWFRRWHAAIPHAVRAYAQAVREAGDRAISKYSESLQRFAQNKRKHGRQRPGA